ncbi:MAG: HD domain-containing phosphohydrolase [Vicinamibacterales bacterium]
MKSELLRGQTPASVVPKPGTLLGSLPLAGSVLVVDDDQQSLRLLTRLLERDGFHVHTATDGEAALASLVRLAPDLILLDVGLPGLNGFEICRRVKSSPATRLTPVVIVTGHNAHEHRLEGINSGADDFLGKPFDGEELRARVRSLIRLKRHTDDLESAEAVILSLALTVEARDAYTEGHCARLAKYAVTLGRAVGLGEEDLAALYRGGYLHDLGKIAIPDALLHKPTSLTSAEFELMKRHTIVGEHLCGNLRSLRKVRPIVRCHHEKLDGSGYPDGLSGRDVPLLAQIVSIVDAYDAITTTRPYRVALSTEHAFGELRRDAAAGARSAELVEAFVALGREGQLEITAEVSSSANAPAWEESS